jgi:hypothetical protein
VGSVKILLFRLYLIPLQTDNLCQEIFRYVLGIIDRSYVSNPSGASLFAFKISLLYRIFRFSCLRRASLHCELIWAINLSAATFVAPYCDMELGIYHHPELLFIFSYFVAPCRAVLGKRTRGLSQVSLWCGYMLSSEYLDCSRSFIFCLRN